MKINNPRHIKIRACTFRFSGDMMKFLKYLFIFALLLCIPAAAQAAQPKQYVVTPFSVNGPDGYSYLKNAIHPMVATHLRWPGNYELMSNDKAAKTSPRNTAEAKKILNATKADYLVWGTVTIIGTDCEMDVTVSGKDGQEWARKRNTKIDLLIPEIKNLSDSISSEVFKRPGLEAVAVRNAEPAKPSGPAYAGSVASSNASGQYGREKSDAVMRSQTLDYQALGMEICDTDGDGSTEVFLIDQYNIYAYKYSESRLTLLAKQQVALNTKNLNIRSYDFDRSGRKKLIINTVDADNMPNTRVYSFAGKNFTLEVDRCRYYLNVVKDVASRRETLIGQLGDKYEMFKPGSLSEMSKSGNQINPIAPLNLKRGDFNVFNFAYLPSGNNLKESAKVVSITPQEKLRVSTIGGARLSTSDEMYSGTPAGIEVNPTILGMGNDTESIRSMYYIPMRLLVADLAGAGDYDLIANHPVTTAGTIFKRYRSFQKSEVRFLHWDGIGLSQSSPPRIYQGAVVDTGLADLDNDGKLDIITCVNTNSGLESTKTVLHATKLTLSAKK